MAINQEQVRDALQLKEALAETRYEMNSLGVESVRVQSDVSLAMSRVTSQVRQLGNTLVPVANVGLNLFSRLLRLLQPVARGIASFVTTIFGTRLAGTVRNLNKTADALNRTTKSAAKATKATKALAKAQRDLMSFDQINKLSDRKTSRAGGSTRGGSGGGGVKVSGSGGQSVLRSIEVPVFKWGEGFRQMLRDIWTPFQRAWKSKGEKVTKSARTALEKIGAAAKSFCTTWVTIWKNKAGEKIVCTVLDIVARICDVAGILAERFRIAWESCGNGHRIVTAVYEIIQDLLKWVEQIVDATAEWAETLDFAALLSSLADMLESFQKLADVLEDRLASGYKKVLLPLAKWAIEDGAPNFLEALAKGMDTISGILERIGPKLDSIEYFFKKNLSVDAVITLVKSGWTTVASWVSSAAGGVVSKAISLSKTWSTVKSWVESHGGGTVSKLVSLAKSDGNPSVPG